MRLQGSRKFWISYIGIVIVTFTQNSSLEALPQAAHDSLSPPLSIQATGSISIDWMSQDNPATSPNDPANYQPLTFTPISNAPIGYDNYASPIVYGGSEPSTSDNLEATVSVNPPPAHFKWSVRILSPGGTQYVTSRSYSGPDNAIWNFDVQAIPGSYEIDCQAIFPDGSYYSISSQHILVGIRTDDVLVLAWLGAANVPTLSTSGVSSWALQTFPVSAAQSGQTLPTTQIPFTLAALLLMTRNWTYEQTYLPAPIVPASVAPLYTLTWADRQYISNWLIKLGGDSPPPSDLRVPQNPQVPNQVDGIDYDYIDYNQLNTLANPPALATTHEANYRAFNHLQLKYLVGANGYMLTFVFSDNNTLELNGNGLPVLQPSVPQDINNVYIKTIDPVGKADREVGITEDPVLRLCGPLDIPVTVIVPAPPPDGHIVLIADTVKHELPAQNGPSTGLFKDQSTSEAALRSIQLGVTRVSGIVNGALDPPGVRIANTLRAMNLPPGAPPPKYLESIGSQIRFTYSGGASPLINLPGNKPFTQNFPNYTMYYNGKQVYFQPLPSIGAFALYRSNPYPFGGGISRPDSSTLFLDANFTSLAFGNSNNTPGGRYGSCFADLYWQGLWAPNHGSLNLAGVDIESGSIPAWAMP